MNKQHPVSPPRPCTFSDENVYCVSIHFGKVDEQKLLDAMEAPIPSCTIYDVRQVGPDKYRMSWLVASPMSRGEVAPAFAHALNLRHENQVGETTYYGIAVDRVRATNGFAR